MTTHDYAMSWPVNDDTLPLTRLQRIAEPDFYRALAANNLTQNGPITWATTEVAGQLFIGARAPVLTYRQKKGITKWPGSKLMTHSTHTQRSEEPG